MEHLSQRTDIDTSRVVVFGRSLGGAVGAVLTKNNPDKVFLKLPSKHCSIFIYLLIKKLLFMIVRRVLEGFFSKIPFWISPLWCMI